MVVAESIKRPFTSFSRLVAGILISSIPIVNFLSLGYVLDCFRTARRKEFELPEWNELWEKFSQGSFSFLIMLIYFIPFIVAIKLMGIPYSSLLHLESLDVVSTKNLAILSLLQIVGMYMIPASLKKYALTGSFKEVFSKEVLRSVFKTEYLLIWLVGIILLIIISSLFGFIPYIGGGIIIFLTGVMFSTYYGVKDA